jgi:hypothetical protein
MRVDAIDATDANAATTPTHHQLHQPNKKPQDKNKTFDLLINKGGLVGNHS